MQYINHYWKICKFAKKMFVSDDESVSKSMLTKDARIPCIGNQNC